MNVKCAIPNSIFPMTQKYIGLVHEGRKNSQYQICDVIFDPKSNLHEHMTSLHEGDQYHSQIWNVKFDFTHDMKTHMPLVHEGEKTCKCQICNAVFALKTDLNK